VDIQINLLKKRLEASKIILELTDNAREYLADAGFDPVYGARPLKRAIQQIVQNPLSMRILEGQIREGSKVTMDIVNGKVVFM
jgi:ATP-dependent Clp protease ATP-binding subunit ClpB